MYEKPKRPASVWISQIILALLMLLFCMVVYTGIRQTSVAQMAFMLIVLGLYIAFLGMTFWGLATRRPLGRWMMVGFICLVVVSSIARLPSDPNMADNVPGGYKIGYLFSSLLGPALLGLLAFFLIKSPNVEEFFAKPEEEEVAGPPPIEAYAKDLSTENNLTDSNEVTQENPQHE